MIFASVKWCYIACLKRYHRGENDDIARRLTSVFLICYYEQCFFFFSFACSQWTYSAYRISCNTVNFPSTSSTERSTLLGSNVRIFQLLFLILQHIRIHILMLEYNNKVYSKGNIVIANDTNRPVFTVRFSKKINTMKQKKNEKREHNVYFLTGKVL